MADSISECLCVGVVGIVGMSARVSALYRGRGELYTGWVCCYSCVLALKLIKVFRKTDNKIDCIGVNTHCLFLLLSLLFHTVFIVTEMVI